MVVKSFTIELNSQKRFQIIDITPHLFDFLQKSRIKEGQLLVFSKHTTLAIVINENESNLLEDLENFLEKILPFSNSYFHPQNAASHLRQFLLGTSKTIPIEKSQLILGAWQRVFAIELDGPRKREILLQFIGN